jgi:transcriptional regulator with XRE-family HTH domain
MIRNERQYRITTRQRKLLADELRQLLDQDEVVGYRSDQEQLLFDLQQASLEGQIADLDEQIMQYDQLRAGQLQRVRVTSLSELPKALVQARIAAGMSQRELAQRLGLKEQQIQRYETEDYASASLARLEDVRRALGVELEAGIDLPTIDSPLQRLKQRLAKLGLERALIDRRIVGDMGNTASPAKALAVAERAARLLSLNVQQLLSPADIQLPALATTARFKAPANAAPDKLDAYTRYAEGVADIVLKATADLPAREFSANARVVREAINAWLEDHEELTEGVGSEANFPSKALFKGTLQHLFDRGILVIALRDPGAFHGACFTADGRSVIVLKQTTDSVARWLADLLHEAGHLADEDRGNRRTWVELGDISSWSDDPEERRAHDFAADVLFEGRARPVLEACLREARGSVERLKTVVPQVAREADVSVDVLANYVAHQLSQRGINWWSTAAGFQEANTPWRTATDILLSHLDFTVLDPVERAALLDALAA